MNSTLLEEIVDEFISEKRIIAYEEKEVFIGKLKLAIQFFDETIVATKIDYDKDLEARNLLKEYVFYDFYNRLPEFKERYANDFIQLQFKYNSTSLQ